MTRRAAHASPAFVSAVSAGLRLLRIFTLIGLGTPVVVFLMRVRHAWGISSAQYVFKKVLRALHITLDVNGKACDHDVLFVANHVSYIDIIVLGSLLKTRFVAKEEVARWPFVGLVARAIGVVFVSRSPHKTKQELLGIQQGRSIVLFPEGTSTDGTRVLEFRSSFFQIALMPGHPMQVQPVSLTYHTLCGQPLGQFFRKIIGWRGDVGFMESLRTLLRLGPLGVSVTFHPPLDPHAFANRKALAARCQETVSQGVVRCIQGLPRLCEKSFGKK